MTEVREPSEPSHDGAVTDIWLVNEDQLEGAMYVLRSSDDDATVVHVVLV